MQISVVKLVTYTLLTWIFQAHRIQVITAKEPTVLEDGAGTSLKKKVKWHLEGKYCSLPRQQKLRSRKMSRKIFFASRICKLPSQIKNK
jgi:hypothetical protein